MGEDKRLERLYDYTKWHIGIYLSMGTGLVAGIGYLAHNASPWEHIGKIPLLGLAFLAMVGAGIAGGIVGSSLTSSAKWEDFWEKKQGIGELHLFKGKTWTHIEHFCFWLSLFLATAGVLNGELASITKFAPNEECKAHTSQTTDITPILSSEPPVTRY